MQWRRKAAGNGDSDACRALAARMYVDFPYAREVGLVGEAAGVATSVWVIEGHDVPLDVLTSVVYWLPKGGSNPVDKLDDLCSMALQGAPYCWNEGCEVMGHMKGFKFRPQCKTARYCSSRARLSANKHRFVDLGQGESLVLPHAREGVCLNKFYSAFGYSSGAFNFRSRWGPRGLERGTCTR